MYAIVCVNVSKKDKQMMVDKIEQVLA